MSITGGGSIRIQLSATETGEPTDPGPEFVQAILDADNAFILIDEEGNEVTVEGPEFSGNSFVGTEEPYLYTPASATQILAWDNARGGDNDEVSIRILIPVRNLDALFAATGGLAAEFAAERHQINVDVSFQASAALAAEFPAETQTPVDLDASFAATGGLAAEFAAERHQINVDVSFQASAALAAEFPASAVHNYLDVGLGASGALAGEFAADAIFSFRDVNLGASGGLAAEFTADTSAPEEFSWTINGILRTGLIAAATATITRKLGTRALCDFEMAVTDYAEIPIENQAVVVSYAGVRLFSGAIYEPDVVDEAEYYRVKVSAEGRAARLEDVIVEDFVRPASGSSGDELMQQLFDDWLAGEGLTLDTDLTDTISAPAPWDYIPVAEAATLITDAAHGIWCVTVNDVLMVRSRQALPDSGLTITADMIDGPITRSIDRQNLRTKQTVLGGPHQHGQRREDFQGDGSRREFPLEYRFDRVIEVAVNGATVTVGTGEAWSIDAGRSVLVQDSGETPLLSSDDVSVLYNYNLPVIVTRTNATAAATFGTIHRVEHDPSIDDLPAAEHRTETQLDRHDFPTVRLSFKTSPGAVPTTVSEGQGVKLDYPRFNINDSVSWLLDEIGISEEVPGLVTYHFTLLRRDHEPTFEAYWNQIGRVPIPSKLTAPVAPGTADLDPTILALEGVRLPRQLGGDYRATITSDAWAPIPGYSVVRLNGDRLPSNLVEWLATIEVVGSVSMRLRLYDVTNDVTRGGEVIVGSSDPDLVLKKRITLSAGAADYRLEARMSSAVSGRASNRRPNGGRVRTAEIDVGD